MKTVYECDHCGEYTPYIDDMLEHEHRCPYNPATKHCGTCSAYTSISTPYGTICGFGLPQEINQDGGCQHHRSRK